MRVKLISAALVLALCVVFCVVSARSVFSLIDEASALCEKALQAVDRADYDEGRAVLVNIATLWQDAGDTLEALTPHEDLQAVTTEYIEALTELEHMDLDDFYTSMALLREKLRHLRDHESLRLSNLL